MLTRVTVSLCVQWNEFEETCVKLWYPWEWRIPCLILPYNVKTSPPNHTQVVCSVQQSDSGEALKGKSASSYDLLLRI
jgi:hypothetical protein